VQYKVQKGTCEDLDEGKFSLPLIHVLNNSTHAHLIRGILSQRRVAGKLTDEQKRLVVRRMTDAGSLEFTLQILRAMYRDLEAEVDQLEQDFGQSNFQLRLVLSMLKL
jgi:geranylgeranyl pyrophosphate synthase